jgi:hypothetical protein
VSNVINGAVATGVIKDGSGSGPSYDRMLSNCPPIKDFCDLDISRMPMLIERCRVIAREMAARRAINSRNYMGTPDDQRMVESFGEFLGPFSLELVM